MKHLYLSVFVLSFLFVSVPTSAQHNWDRIAIPINKYSLPRACTFFDSSGIIVVGDSGLILRSLDNGKSWENVSVDKKFQFNSVAFADNSIGIVTTEYGTEAFLKTTDKGKSWNVIPNDIIPGAKPYRIQFDKNGFGMIFCIYGIYFITNDKGTTWKKRSVSGFKERLTGVLIDSTHWAMQGLYLDSTGMPFTLISATSDAGASWQMQKYDSYSPYYTLYDIQAYGDSSYISSGEMSGRFSHDGVIIVNSERSNYHNRYPQDFVPVEKIGVVDTAEWYVLKSTPRILHTINTGKDWTTEFIDSSLHFTDIQVRNKTKVVVTAFRDPDTTVILILNGIKNSIHSSTTQEQGITITPNPTDGKITLRLDDLNASNETNIVITNLLGVTVKRFTFNENLHEPIEINIADLPNGMYRLSARVGDTLFARNIIKCDR
jgi:hypothetical protein